MSPVESTNGTGLVWRRGGSGEGEVVRLDRFANLAFFFLFSLSTDADFVFSHFPSQ